jgi:hypothetical protein
VGEHIFINYIQKMLKNKTVILVTHGVQVLLSREPICHLYKYTPTRRRNISQSLLGGKCKERDEKKRTKHCFKKRRKKER